MFFGAGNLIFPPFLGAQAGTDTWTAMLGFTASAIGFPILGVIAVARSGGLNVLAGRVHPKFAFWFTFLIYLSIGPCLAIPRTAGTSFEMAVIPFLPEHVTENTARLLYSIVFFGLAFTLALKPDKLTSRLGKVLTPCLLTLIVVVFAGCLLNPVGRYGTPIDIYSRNPLVSGFLDGYLTMDTIAALNFGIIISLNIRAMGLCDENSIIKETIKAGLIAGGILLMVYSALAHVGAVTGGAFGTAENGAKTLNQIVNFLYGRAGMVLLGLIFFIACLNTCVGLISCCSRYFSTIFPKVSYVAWAIVFTAVSLLIADVGLSNILAISVPVLNAIYPVAIVLIVLSFIDPLFGGAKEVYRCGIAFTGVMSLLLALEQVGVLIPFVTAKSRLLPFYDAGLAWVIPAVLGVIAGILASKISTGSPGIGHKDFQ